MSLPETFFETDRIYFRPFTLSDCDRLVEIQSDKRVYQYVGDSTPLTPEVAKGWIKNSHENIKRFGFGTGAIIEKDGDQLCGWAGFARPTDQPEELIYGFAHASWGKGYGSEILRGLMKFAAEKTQIRTLRATVDAQNTASIHLLKKHGFIKTAQDHLGEDGCDLYERSSIEH